MADLRVRMTNLILNNVLTFITNRAVQTGTLQLEIMFATASNLTFVVRMHLAPPAHLVVMAIRDTNKPLPPMNPVPQLTKWRKDTVLKLLSQLQLRAIFPPWKVS